jgi:hypothetical protein
VFIYDWADHTKPSGRQYLLHADTGQRYNLVAGAGVTSEWVTDMHLTVSAQPLASSASPGTIALPSLRVNAVAAASAAMPSGSQTAAAGTAGNAPADMSVLFVILTVCDQKAATTIEVSCDCDRGARL